MAGEQKAIFIQLFSNLRIQNSTKLDVLQWALLNVTHTAAQLQDEGAEQIVKI